MFYWVHDEFIKGAEFHIRTVEKSLDMEKRKYVIYLGRVAGFSAAS